MERINNKIVNLKIKIQNHYSFEKSLNYIMKIAIKYYVFSINFNDIYYGRKNPKQFKMCVFIYILSWLLTICAMSFLLSDYLYSFIDGSFENLRVILFFITVSSSMIVIGKTDFLLAEVKSNLKPFKIFYYLINDMKSKHKLSRENYKKLAILSRILQIFIIDYGLKAALVLGFIASIRVALESRTLFVQLSIILFIFPIGVIYCFTAVTYFFIIYSLIYYYKLLFDQINNQFKLISQQIPLVINKTKENQLIRLIKQHNLISIEIYEINLLVRRTVAFVFIIFSLIKIISCYLIIYSNDILIKFAFGNMVIGFTVFSFGMSYLFSLQIKSAHQSYQIIHSIISKYKMRFHVKIKVKKFDEQIKL